MVDSRIILQIIIFSSIPHVVMAFLISLHPEPVGVGCLPVATTASLNDVPDFIPKVILSPSPPFCQRIHALFSTQRPMELENEQSLATVFERALILQRAGNTQEALEQYQLFCKAAAQCKVDPSQYAEVHVNMGAIHLRQNQPDLARDHFGEALQHRQLGTAHVNLAVLNLRQATSVATLREEGLKCLQSAKHHCQKAVALKDDPRSVDTAKRLLMDIDKMLGD